MTALLFLCRFFGSPMIGVPAWPVSAYIGYALVSLTENEIGETEGGVPKQTEINGLLPDASVDYFVSGLMPKADFVLNIIHS